MSLREYVENGYKIGPNYQQPGAVVSEDWIDSNDPLVKSISGDYSNWWRVFNDPVLDSLIQNRTRSYGSVRSSSGSRRTTRSSTGKRSSRTVDGKRGSSVTFGRKGGAIRGPSGGAVGGAKGISVTGPRGKTATRVKGGAAVRGPSGSAVAGIRGGSVGGVRVGTAQHRSYQHRHDNWHHGHWHGHAHGNWYAHPGAWGLAAWGVGNLIYDWGYYPYSNPYYVENSVADQNPTVDYSEPIAEPTSETDEESLACDEAMKQFDAARKSFKQGNSSRALQQVNAALKRLPNDSVLHEFRALCLFALKDYKQAAAGVYAVLSAGPGWDWTTLVSLYRDADVYQDQLRTLERYRNQNPTSGDAHFLLAYHYLTCGHDDQAVMELKAVVKLVPDDRLSAQLLAKLSGNESGESQTSVEPVESTPPEASSLSGTWQARRDDRSAFQLAFQKDGTFSWSFTHEGKTQKFSGKFTYANGLLTLVPSDGGAMVATLSATGENTFNFKLVGEPPGDAGLNFSR